MAARAAWIACRPFVENAQVSDVHEVIAAFESQR
jgi:hypothetical protein